MTTEQRVAEVIRDVTADMQTAINDGRPERIDVHDLLEVLLNIAERLEAPFAPAPSLLDQHEEA